MVILWEGTVSAQFQAIGLFTKYLHQDILGEITAFFASNVSDQLFCWFPSNQMKVHHEKSRVITICDKEMDICVNNYNISKSENY